MIGGSKPKSAFQIFWDYTMIGDVVNTAQRLQSVAAPGQIIINDTAYEKIKQSLSCTRVNEVRLKNKANPVTIYNVMDWKWHISFVPLLIESLLSISAGESKSVIFG